MNTKKAYYKFVNKFIQNYPLGSWQHEVQYIEALSQDWFIDMIYNSSIYTDYHRDRVGHNSDRVEIARLSFASDLRSAYQKLKPLTYEL
jgi:hypothetical protein